MLKIFLQATSKRLSRLPVAIALFAATVQVKADPLQLPKSADEALDAGAMISEMVMMTVLANIILSFATLLFVVAHIALIVMVVVGWFREKHWRFAIKICCVFLVIMYVLIFYLFFRSGVGDVASQHTQAALDFATQKHQSQQALLLCWAALYSGDWRGPASLNRPAIQIDDVMPDELNSVYGDTIWQWEDDQT